MCRTLLACVLVRRGHLLLVRAAVAELRRKLVGIEDLSPMQHADQGGQRAQRSEAIRGIHADGREGPLVVGGKRQMGAWHPAALVRLRRG